MTSRTRLAICCAALALLAGACAPGSTAPSTDATTEASGPTTEAAGGATATAEDTDYPTREITLTVVYPAGSAPDSTARTLAAVLEEELGQPVVVVNAEGGNGIVGLTQVAAQEWAPDVRVNAVGPGDVETEMMEREWAQEGQLRQIDAAAVKEEYRTRLLLGTLQTPDDIAGVVTFLCSPLASQITGLHLVASGGLPYTAGNTGASGDVASM